MSVLREMAEELAKKLDGEADFFLVVQSREADPSTGKKKKYVATNVDMTVGNVARLGEEITNG